MPDFGVSQLLSAVPDFVFAATVAAAGVQGAAISEITADGHVAPREGAYFERVVLPADMPREVRGTKLSQRAEAKEHTASDDVNTEGRTIWYAFSVHVDPSTGLPRPAVDAQSAKLSIAQFHQRDANGKSDRPAIMFYMLGDGSIHAQFEAAVGKRRYKLVSGGRDGTAAMGQWLDVVVGAHWNREAGWTEFWVRREGEQDYTRVARDEGRNTSTGHLYFKYGLYRSFLERDPWLARDGGLAYYDAVRRGDTFAAVRLPAPASDARIALADTAAPVAPRARVR